MKWDVLLIEIVLILFQISVTEKSVFIVSESKEKETIKRMEEFSYIQQTREKQNSDLMNPYKHRAMRKGKK